jgi:hypothetical protein
MKKMCGEKRESGIDDITSFLLLALAANGGLFQKQEPQPGGLHDDEVVRDFEIH